jgi:hypothetical protein
MACQGFTGELFHKEVLPGMSCLGLLCQVTMVCASSTANYGTMVPFFFEAFTVGETPTAPKFYIRKKRYLQIMYRKKDEKVSRKVLNP